MNFKKILCLVMALIMVGSVTLTPIFAATEEDDDYLFSHDRSEDLMVGIISAIPDVLIEEAKAYYDVAEDIAYDIYENHEEYYAEGYDYLLENGYIDVAIDSIIVAIEAIKKVNLEDADISDELREKLEVELEATIPTLDKIIAILESDEIDNFDGFVNALLTLEGDLYTHLNNIYAICEQAGIELNQDILLPTFNYALDVLQNEVIPAIKVAVEAFVDAVVAGAIDRLTPYFEKVAEILNISRETYNLIIETIVKLDLFVEGTIDAVLEAHNKLVATLLAIYGNIEDAIRSAVEFYDKVIETIVDFNTKVENTITDTVEGINNFIIEVTNAYNYTVALLIKTYGLVKNAVIVANQIYDYAVDFVIANKPLVEEGIENAIEFAKNVYAEVVEILEAAYAEKDDVYSVAAQISAYVIDVLTKIDSEIKDTFDKAVNGNYELTDDSLYIALGNSDYADALAEKLNLGNKLHKFDITGNYAEKLPAADLVTIKLDNGEFMTLAEAQVMGVFAELVKTNEDLMAWYNNPFFGKIIKQTIDNVGIDMDAEVVELDWSKYLDEEGKAALDSTLASIKERLLANNVPEYYEFDFNPIIEKGFEDNGMGGIFTWSFDPIVVPVADLVVFAVENALYGYAGFTNDLVTVLNNINTLAPDATVVLSGVSNPLVGFEIFGLDLSAYASSVDSVVDLLNVQLHLFAVVDENTIFVENNDANAIYDALNVHCEHVYADCVDTDCNRCLAVREAPGHKYTNYVFNNDSTCTKDGTETAICDNCGGSKDTRTAVNTKAGHNWIEATCTSPKKCSVCEKLEGEKADHVMGDWRITKDPTSKEMGIEESKCLHCDHKETRFVENDRLELIAIVAIVVACVAVVGGASAGLAAWLRKKNKI